jgi:DNA ligase 4
VLLLDSKSLLSEPYSARRSLLESLIAPIDFEAFLVDRWHIDLSHGSAHATKQLQHVFAESIAARQEGLVLKASGSFYNARRWPWVKLKKDYIPGYGDAVDLVLIGAAWEKDRARVLRGIGAIPLVNRYFADWLIVSSDTLTTFYLGTWSKGQEQTGDVSISNNVK